MNIMKNEKFNRRMIATIQQLLSECKFEKLWYLQRNNRQPCIKDMMNKDIGKDVLLLTTTVPGCEKSQTIQIIIKTKRGYGLDDIKIFNDWTKESKQLKKFRRNQNVNHKSWKRFPGLGN